MSTAASTPELSIVIPVYNEPDNIGPTLRGLHAAVTTPAEVIVVYDFDADTTVPVVRELANEMPEVRLLRNDLGRGVLNAMKAGIGAARGEYVLVTMADGSDEPELVDHMVAAARDGGADLVAASRYMKGGRQEGGPRLKRLLSRFAGLSLHWFGRLPIHDATNNFKLYRRSFLESVRIESRGGFELAIELSVKADLAGRRLAELPTTWRDRTAGESRFKFRAWWPLYLRWYLHLFAGRVRNLGSSRRVPVALGLLVLVGLFLWHLPSLDQKLIEVHSFRQTQTAWTALIYHREGIDLLHPRVPVFGPPFDLPFEFPLFQALASLVMNAGVAPDVAMRFSGLVTFVVAALLVWRLTVRLAGEWSGLVALLAFTLAPLGLEWSRTSMIEYFVLASALAMLYAALRWHDSARVRWWLVALVAGVIALLVKPTTAVIYLPALAVLALPVIRSATQRKMPARWRYLVQMAALFVVPLVIGAAWTIYADGIKAAHEFTAGQTSAALTTWNYGTIAQRLNPVTWQLIGVRFENYLAGGAGILWIPLAFIGAWSLPKRRLFAVVLLASGLLGPLIFVNLYWIHDYYLIALSPMVAIGIALALRWLIRMRRWIVPPLLAGGLLVAWVLTMKGTEAYWTLQFKGTQDFEKHLVAAAYIDERSTPTDLIAVTGRGWNPALLYYADRKGLMVVGTAEASFSDAMGRLLPGLRADGYTLIFNCPSNTGCEAAYDITVSPPRLLP
jgi:dolichol-phosphate mannosyltransferase